MSVWSWAVGVLAGLVYGLPSLVRTWRRERALTAQCVAEEHAKTDALKRHLRGGQ